MDYPNLRRDAEANAAYLALHPVGPGGVAKSLPLTDDAGGVLMVVDFSAEGRVLGIEFLDAATQLGELEDE